MLNTNNIHTYDLNKELYEKAPTKQRLRMDPIAVATVVLMLERPELFSLKGLKLSDLSLNPGRGIRW